VAVAFKDMGAGISPEQLGRIFEPYHTTKAEGSGLGLMIVQRVIRDHGGEIEVHSEPERGTTVTLFLPREHARIRLLKAHRPGKKATAEGTR
jgi:signal transduction histidine kinase